jgi:hypothetical protein
MKRFLSSAILLTICSFARAQSGIDLHNMKTGDEGYMNVFVPSEIRGGDATVYHVDHFRVISVIDDKTVLVQPLRYGIPGGGVVERRDDGPPLMLTGISTKDVVDGKVLSTEGSWLKVDGTKKYATVSGASKTVYYLRLETDEHKAKRLTSADAEAKVRRDLAARLQAAVPKEAPPGKKGAAVYDEVEEPLRSKLVENWQKAVQDQKDEIGRLHNSISIDNDRLSKAASPKNRQALEFDISRLQAAEKRLVELEYNDPPYPEQEKRAEEEDAQILLRRGNNSRKEAQSLMSQARAYYRKVLKDYPHSKAAVKAKGALKEMDK